MSSRKDVDIIREFHFRNCCKTFSYVPIIASKMDDLQQGDTKIQLEKYAPHATYFFRLAEKFAQKKNIEFDINEYVIPGDNLATVTNYYNLLSSWRNFDSEDDIPEAFRFNKV